MTNTALQLLFTATLTTTLALSLAACGQPESTVPAVTEAKTPGSAPAATPPETAPETTRTASAEGAAVTILSPPDGAVLSSPVKVVFGLQAMGLAPAGDYTPNTGHHHLLVDVPAPDLGQVIPKDANHLHFGQGQYEAEITLAPGSHTLQLLFADGNHLPHNPPLMSPPITIIVQ